MILLMIPSMPTAAEILPFLEEVDQNRWYTNFGPLEQRFRKQLHHHLRLSSDTHVVLITNGTLALQLALEAFQLPTRSVCLLPSWTFSATALAVMNAGLTPHFIDVDPHTWMITPEHVEQVIHSTNIQPYCVVVVVPFGMPFNIQPWEELSAKHNLAILIDAAASHEDIPTGRIPVMISLHATKMLSMGEGGAILSTDHNYMQKLKSLSNFGFERNRISTACGTNAKVSEYNAAIGLAMLDHYPGKRQKLMQLAQHYHQAFQNVEGVTLQPGFGETWVGSTLNIELHFGNIQALHDHLQQQAIESRQWWQPCHSQPAFTSCTHEPLTVTLTLSEKVIGLPFHTFLSPEDIEKVATTVADFMAQYKVRVAS
jgi:dTDP-4-amino-4,6-dideoxygalactose transaminase